MKNKMITIDARRWFQKTYGNTYHSVKVYVDNKLIGESGKHYGYGGSYLQTAHEILAKHGVFSYEHTKELIPVYKKDRTTGQPTSEIDYHTQKESQNSNKAYSDFIQDMRTNRAKYHVTCVDVSREKDL